MSTLLSSVADTDIENTTLPPNVVINPREKALPEEIPVTDLIPHCKEKPIKNAPLVWEPNAAPPRLPSARRSLAIAWSPPCLCFNLDQDILVRHLTVWNSTTHSIYVQCCGLWNDLARFGASWTSTPRKRFRLAPGLSARFTITAKPREHPSSIPLAYVALQLAASHMRDLVTGYFVVPIQVTFGSYIPPPEGEGG